MNAHTGSSIASVETLLGQVADEFTERLNRGEQPEIEEYARLHPEISELLRQVLPALQVMAPPTLHPSHESADELAALGGFLGDFRIGQRDRPRRHGNCVRSGADFAAPPRGPQSAAFRRDLGPQAAATL